MFRFPWSNFHELNLDWILEVVKEAKEIFVNGRSDIDNAVDTANEALEVAEQAAAAVIADGVITIPKLNNEVLKTTAYVIVGNRADEAVPAGAYVYLRNSLVSGLADGIYTAAANIPAGAIVTPTEFQQSTALRDSGALNVLKNTLTSDEGGLAIPKSGGTANEALAAGTFIHLTNSGNANLPDGYYQVASGGIASGASYSTSNLIKQNNHSGGGNGALNTLRDSLFPYYSYSWVASFSHALAPGLYMFTSAIRFHVALIFIYSASNGGVISTIIDNGWTLTLNNNVLTGTPIGGNGDYNIMCLMKL